MNAFEDIAKKHFSRNNYANKYVVGALTGAALGLAGEAVSNQLGVGPFKDNDISGRVKLVHGTKSTAVQPIQDTGLLRSHAKDADNTTNRVAGNINQQASSDIFKVPEVVYTQKSIPGALGMSLIAEEGTTNKKEILYKRLQKLDEEGWDPNLVGSYVELSIPYDEYIKLPTLAENPEMLNAKSAEEYFQLYTRHVLKRDPETFELLEPTAEGVDPQMEAALRKRGGLSSVIDGTEEGFLKFKNIKKDVLNELKEEMRSKCYSKWSLLQPSEGNTVIFTEDIPTKYIVGSKDYKGLSLSEQLQYIKNHPARVVNGIVKCVLPVGLLATLGAVVPKLLRR
ncbi:MAG: hypothetical protein MJZ34_02760 [Paludibacteraceae bacterium]|nr:hypothetical protein [Paludibacteraceae bacterium]